MKLCQKPAKMKERSKRNKSCPMSEEQNAKDFFRKYQTSAQLFSVEERGQEKLDFFIAFLDELGKNKISKKYFYIEFFSSEKSYFQRLKKCL